MILQLPPDIYRIVYKYLYDSVLSHFKSWYGTAPLKQVRPAHCCKRINDDVGHYYGYGYTRFYCMVSSGDPANANMQQWRSRLDRRTEFVNDDCNAS